MSPALVGVVEIAPLAARVADNESLGIAGKGFWAVAVHITGKLVEDEDEELLVAS